MEDKIENINNEQNIEQNETVINDDAKNDNIENNETKETKENYFGYNIFVFISAIIGFIFVYFATRFIFYKYEEKNNIVLHNQKFIIAIFIALIAVILFMFISLSFKKVLKKIYLSETFLYLYIGFLTTVINFLVFKAVSESLININLNVKFSWKLAEIAAFIVGVLFAFFGDKIIVFKSQSLYLKVICS